VGDEERKQLSVKAVVRGVQGEMVKVKGAFGQKLWKVIWQKVE
jgi:hypothetical protein